MGAGVPGADGWPDAQSRGGTRILHPAPEPADPLVLGRNIRGNLLVGPGNNPPPFLCVCACVRVWCCAFTHPGPSFAGTNGSAAQWLMENASCTWSDDDIDPPATSTTSGLARRGTKLLKRIKGGDTASDGSSEAGAGEGEAADEDEFFEDIEIGYALAGADPVPAVTPESIRAGDVKKVCVLTTEGGCRWMPRSGVCTPPLLFLSLSPPPLPRPPFPPQLSCLFLIATSKRTTPCSHGRPRTTLLPCLQPFRTRSANLLACRRSDLVPRTTRATRRRQPHRLPQRHPARKHRRPTPSRSRPM